MKPTCPLSVFVCTSSPYRRATLQSKLNNLRQFHIHHCSSLQPAPLMLAQAPIGLLLIDPAELYDLAPLLVAAPRPVRAVLCTRTVERFEQRVLARLLRATGAELLGELPADCPVASRQRALWLHLQALARSATPR
ncbi:hypothetical protein IAE35_09930 [Pseudomonas sp. S75]|uniref:hypothetical protein n=1 Tax=unclassified Pseudomonas TaxID=196821 RepID=UPI0019044F86|nr:MULTISPECIES: hypothetical protein [unclassified Pseudomonas]MBJ9976665.1 hypothetical protein [Pseudomonas sp. S30]MBK0153667.1 hypothetical protein [Pseudomonas sp. S75]